jgi:predicted phosphoribosyltransferase
MAEMRTTQVRFRDRSDAGRQLAANVFPYGRGGDALVLALPRGGVPVAFEVARAIHAPLDVFVVRKLGVPGQEELAMGAVASGGVRVVDQELIDRFGISADEVDAVARDEFLELERRERLYREQMPEQRIAGRTVVVVDDGLATGSTMRAALAAIREQHPSRLIVAVPVAAWDTCMDLRREADAVICAVTPEPFYAVGLWYDDFSQTTDAEVRELLARARRDAVTASTPAPRAG